MKWKLRSAEKDKKAAKEEKEILEKVGGSYLWSFYDFSFSCVYIMCKASVLYSNQHQTTGPCGVEGT